MQGKFEHHVRIFIITHNFHRSANKENSLQMEKSKIKSLIARGRLEEALEDVIIQIENIKDNEVKNDFILQSSRLQRILREKNVNTETTDNINTTINQIISGILSMLDKIETETRESKPNNSLRIRFSKKRELNISEILSYKSDFVQFLGLTKEKKELERWVELKNQNIFRIISGEGGSGKSRMALEICELLRSKNDGWYTEFVNLEKDFNIKQGYLKYLFVVDNPEEYQLRLIGFLDTIQNCSKFFHVKVLFLSRNGQSWWTSNKCQIPFSDYAHYFHSEFQIGKLGEKSIYRLFKKTWKRLPKTKNQQKRKFKKDEIDEWINLDKDNNSKPLFVLGAAIYSGLNPQKEINLSGVEIIKILVQIEQSRLKKTAKSIGISPFILPRVVALASFTGSLSEKTIIELTNHQLRIGIEDANEFINKIEKIELWISGKLHSIQPDILSASLLIEELKDRKDSVPEWLWVILKEKKLSNFSERLTRLLHDVFLLYPQKKDFINYNILKGWLLKMISNDVSRASYLEPIALSLRPSEELLDLCIFINEALVGQNSKDRILHADRLTALAAQLVRAKKSEEAVDYAKNAVEIKKEIGNFEDFNFKKSIVASLYTKSLVFSRIDLEVAKKAGDEADVYIQELMREKDNHWQMQIGEFYNERAILCSFGGDYKQGLEIIKKAIPIFENLSKINESKYLDALRRTHHNIGVFHEGLEEAVKALESLKTAVEYGKKLYKLNPGQAPSGYALSLGSYSQYLLENNKNIEALKHINQCLKVRSKLMQNNPIGYGSSYLHSLFLKRRVLLALQKNDALISLNEKIMTTFHYLIDFGFFVSEKSMFENILNTFLNLSFNYSKNKKEAKEGISYSNLALEFIERIKKERIVTYNNEIHFQKVAIHLNRGNSFLKIRNYNEAIEEYLICINESDEPSQKFAMNGLFNLVKCLAYANCCVGKDKLSLSKESYRYAELCIEEESKLRHWLGESWPTVHHTELIISLDNIAEKLFKQGNYEKSEELYRIAIETIDGFSENIQLVKADARMSILLGYLNVIRIKDKNEAISEFKDKEERIISILDQVEDSSDRDRVILLNTFSNQTALLAANIGKEASYFLMSAEKVIKTALEKVKLISDVELEGCCEETLAFILTLKNCFKEKNERNVNELKKALKLYEQAFIKIENSDLKDNLDTLKIHEQSAQNCLNEII